MKESRYDLGLTLSGGGARGVAHIGVLKALEDHRIQPGILSGSSSGAFVGALYASGMKPLDILDAFKHIDLFRISNYAFMKPGLVASRKFIPQLKELLPDNHFDALRIPMHICATRLLEGEATYFHSGPQLIESILASIAVPGIFTPVKIGDELYIDGGVMDNLPVDQIRAESRIVLAIDVNKINPIQPQEIKHMLDVVARAAQLMVNQNVKLQTSYDYLIRPQRAGDFRIFDLNAHSLDDLFMIGYEAMEEEIEKIKVSMKGKQLAPPNPGDI